jgi:hypothetical protein
VTHPVADDFFRAGRFRDRSDRQERRDDRDEQHLHRFARHLKSSTTISIFATV